MIKRYKIQNQYHLHKNYQNIVKHEAQNRAKLPWPHKILIIKTNSGTEDSNVASVSVLRRSSATWNNSASPLTMLRIIWVTPIGPQTGWKSLPDDDPSRLFYDVIETICPHFEVFPTQYGRHEDHTHRR